MKQHMNVRHFMLIMELGITVYSTELKLSASAGQ